MKVLNLYAGIGGNRKLWENVDVTAIENNKKIAKIYQDFFPNDNVIIADAQEYLLQNYKKFDFIWSSPPCQTHGQFRQQINVKFRGTIAKYPDMSLYEQIIFLRHHAEGTWIVENVRPYYRPLIRPDIILQRHFLWCNFYIQQKDFKSDKLKSTNLKKLELHHGFNLSKYKIANKIQILKNCIYPELGLHIFKHVQLYKKIKGNKYIQKELFN